MDFKITKGFKTVIHGIKLFFDLGNIQYAVFCSEDP